MFIYHQVIHLKTLESANISKSAQFRNKLEHNSEAQVWTAGTANSFPKWAFSKTSAFQS